MKFALNFCYPETLQFPDLIFNACARHAGIGTRYSVRALAPVADRLKACAPVGTQIDRLEMDAWEHSSVVERFLENYLPMGARLGGSSARTATALLLGPRPDVYAVPDQVLLDAFPPRVLTAQHSDEDRLNFWITQVAGRLRVPVRPLDPGKGPAWVGTP